MWLERNLYLIKVTNFSTVEFWFTEVNFLFCTRRWVILFEYKTHPSMTSKHSLSHGGHRSKDPSAWRVQGPSLLQERRSRPKSKTSSEGKTKKWKDFSSKSLYPTMPQIWPPWTFVSKYSLSPLCLDWFEFLSLANRSILTPVFTAQSASLWPSLPQSQLWNRQVLRQQVFILVSVYLDTDTLLVVHCW